MLKLNLPVLGNVASTWADLLHQVTHGSLQQNHVKDMQCLQQQTKDRQPKNKTHSSNIRQVET